MPWPIVLYESWEAAMAAAGEGALSPPIGAMWPAPEWLNRKVDGRPWISDRYFREWADKRPPMQVHMPGGANFLIDSRPTSGGTPGDAEGWVVTGEPPSVTLSPSVNILGIYHGWIQNGVITDDCEGRRFPA